METEKNLTKIKIPNELESDTKLVLQKSFEPFYLQASEWMKKAKALIVSDAGQTKEMAEARVARLALKNIRVDVEKMRKTLKEDSLKKGQAIDTIAKTLKELIEPIESHLEQQEKFAELQDLKMREERKIKRTELLFPYVDNVDFFDLLNMPEEGFAQLLGGSKAGHEYKIAQQKKAEEDRIAKEKADKEERERMVSENEKLKQEQQKKDLQLKQEREKADKEIADAKVKAEAEKTAALAPEKEKLLNLAVIIDTIKFPELQSAEAKEILSNVEILLDKVVDFIKNKAENL